MTYYIPLSFSWFLFIDRHTDSVRTEKYNCLEWIVLLLPYNVDHWKFAFLTLMIIIIMLPANTGEQNGVRKRKGNWRMIAIDY